MDSFQLGDAIDQVKGLHRLYIVVVCKVFSNRLICAISLGSPKPCSIFLTSYGAQKEQTSCKCL